MEISHYKMLFSLLCAAAGAFWLFGRNIGVSDLPKKIAYVIILVGAIITCSCALASFLFTGGIPRGVTAFFYGMNWYLSGMFGYGVGLTCSGVVVLIARWRRDCH
jgi:hypothetical protein